MFNFEVSNQSSYPFYKAQQSIWGATEKVCRKTGAGRLLGLPVTIATVAIYVPSLFAKYGETGVKGTANIVAAPFVKEAKVLTGCTQLLSLTPQWLKILTLPISLTFSGLYLQTGLLFGGANFAKKKHDHFKKQAERVKGSDSLGQQPPQGPQWHNNAGFQNNGGVQQGSSSK